MTDKLPAARILLVNSPESDSELIERLIDSDQRRLKLVPVPLGDFTAELKSSNPSMILMNTETIGDAEAESLKEIRDKAPNVPVIVASQQLGPAQMRRLFSLGVDDWLCKPVGRDELIETVRGITQSGRLGQNAVHAVLSTVGGAGATSVAVSMADLTSAKRLEKAQSVALFDMDFSTGNCGYLLNESNEFNLGTVLAKPDRIDAEFLNIIQKQHPNGFYIYSFKRPEMMTDPNAFELVLRMLDAVSHEHDLTILDVPYYETLWKDDVISAVNSCSLVTALNLPAIRHTLDLIDRFTALRGPEFEINVLFNKWQKSLFGQRISERKLSELFGRRRRVTLSRDEDLLGEAMDRGVPPSEVKSSAAFLKQLGGYIKTLDL